MLRRLGGDGVQTLEQRTLVLSREERKSLVQRSQWVGVRGRGQLSMEGCGVTGRPVTSFARSVFPNYSLMAVGAPSLWRPFEC